VAQGSNSDATIAACYLTRSARPESRAYFTNDVVRYLVVEFRFPDMSLFECRSSRTSGRGMNKGCLSAKKKKKKKKKNPKHCKEKEKNYK